MIKRLVILLFLGVLLLQPVSIVLAGPFVFVNASITDLQGSFIEDALVNLSSNQSNNFNYSNVTDINGKVSFLLDAGVWSSIFCDTESERGSDDLNFEEFNSTLEEIIILRNKEYPPLFNLGIININKNLFYKEINFENTSEINETSRLVYSQFPIINFSFNILSQENSLEFENLEMFRAFRLNSNHEFLFEVNLKPKFIQEEYNLSLFSNSLNSLNLNDLLDSETIDNDFILNLDPNSPAWVSINESLLILQPNAPGNFSFYTMVIDVDSAAFDRIDFNVMVENFNNPLIIEILSPTENFVYNTTEILLDVQVSGDFIDTILFDWNGSEAIYHQPLFIDFFEGMNSLEVSVNDSFGNLNESHIFFFVDTIAPEFLSVPNNFSLVYDYDWAGAYFSAFDISGVESFYINDTQNFVINSDGFLNWTGYLAVGEYFIEVFVNDFVGNTNSVIFNLNITPNDNPCLIYFNETSPLTFPDSFKTWSNCSSIFEMLRNGSLIENDSLQNLGAGAYNFSILRLDQENYSSFYDEQIFIVEKAVPSLNISGDLNITLGDPANIEGTNCPDVLLCTLYRNGEAVSNPDLDILNIGIYNYTFNTSGNQNYTFGEASVQLIVEPFIPQINLQDLYFINEYDNHRFNLSLGDYIEYVEGYNDSLIIEVEFSYSPLQINSNYNPNTKEIFIDFIPEADLLYHEENFVNFTIFVSFLGGQIEKTIQIIYLPVLNPLIGAISNHYNEIPIMNFSVITDGWGLRLKDDNNTFIVFRGVNQDLSFLITKEGFYNSSRFISSDYSELIKNFTLIPNQTNQNGYDYIELGFNNVIRFNTIPNVPTVITRWIEKPIVCVNPQGLTNPYGGTYTPTSVDFMKVNQTLLYYPEFTNGFSDPLNQPGKFIHGVECLDLITEPGHIVINWRSATNSGHGELYNGATIINAVVIMNPLSSMAVYAQEMLQVLGAESDIDNYTQPHFWPPVYTVFCDNPICSLSLPTQLDLQWGKRAYDRELANLHPDVDPSAFNAKKLGDIYRKKIFTEVRTFWTVKNNLGIKKKYSVLEGYYYANEMVYSKEDIFKDLPSGAILIKYPIKGSEDITYNEVAEIKELKDFYEFLNLYDPIEKSN
ncbi:Ig-like domain-containing protein [Patescibacteria group bacterium]|nr:Ig-like domain-containing protein [Patescibacteria group bacterium]